MRTPKKIAFFVISTILVSTNPQARANSPLSDQELEDAILYRNGHASLLTIEPQKSIPFYLLVSESGTGFLMDFPAHDKSATLRLEPNGVPSSWGHDKANPEASKQVAWTRLSSSEAKTLWGKPRNYSMAGSTSVYFETYEVHGSFNGENNIYHLDLRFNKATDRPFEYRVRGIGITNPKFIPAPKSPALGSVTLRLN